MIDNEKDIWALLEEEAPQGCAAVQDLYSWSLNFDAGKGPFPLFLDMIGWSDDEYGDTIYTGSVSEGLGYVELAKLGAALIEYADSPGRVKAYCSDLINAEGQS